MHLERIKVRLVARQQGDAHLQVALTTVLVEVGDKGRKHRFEDCRLLDVTGSFGGGRRFARTAVHDVPSAAHGGADGQDQGQDNQQDKLELTLACRCFCCVVALRHANNPSLFGDS